MVKSCRSANVLGLDPKITETHEVLSIDGKGHWMTVCSHNTASKEVSKTQQRTYMYVSGQEYYFHSVVVTHLDLQY